MFCPRCGMQSLDNVPFCRQCGMRLQNAPFQPNAAAPNQAPSNAAVPNMIAANAQPQFMPPIRPGAAPSPMGGTPKKPGGLSLTAKIGIIAAIAAVIVVAAIVIVVVMNAVQEKSALAAVNESMMEATIRNDISFVQGTVLDTYVDAPNQAFPDLELKSFVVDDRQVDEANGMVTMTGTMVVEKEFFEETAKVRAEYRRTDGRSGEWVLAGLNVISSDIKPLRGILWDAEHKVDTDETGTEMVFDASSQTCAVTVKVDSTLWYGRLKGKQVYHYRFAGRGWEFVNVDQDVKLDDLSKLEGTYERVIPNIHELYGMQKITITDIDLDNLTCKVSWFWNSTLTTGVTVEDRQNNECICSIEPTGSDKGTLKIVVDCPRRDTSDQTRNIKDFGQWQGSIVPQGEGMLKADGRVLRNDAYSMKSQVKTIFSEKTEAFEDVLKKK